MTNGERRRQRKAARIIRTAEKALGTLSRGERTDLLLDNMPGLEDVEAAHRIVDTLAAKLLYTLAAEVAYQDVPRPPMHLFRRDAAWARERRHDDLVDPEDIHPAWAQDYDGAQL